MPCADNKFTLRLPTTEVVNDCADADPLFGTNGATQGFTAYATYPFINAASSSAGAYSPTTISIVLNGGTLVSITATRQNPPDSGAYDIDYKCRTTGCSGVSVSAPVVNNDVGFPVSIRTITLSNTRLASVNADGSLSTTRFATLSGSLTGSYFSNVDLGIVPVLNSDCAPYTQKISWAPVDETSVYGVCPEIFPLPPGTTNLVGGGVRISLPDSPPDNTFGASQFGLDRFVVVTSASGQVTSAFVAANIVPLNENFGCTGNCTGVTVSAPDGFGNRTVTVTNATFHIVEADGFATGARTARINGQFLAPASAPASAMGTTPLTRTGVRALGPRLPTASGRKPGPR